MNIVDFIVISVCYITAFLGATLPVLFVQRAMIQDLRRDYLASMHDYKMYKASVEGDHMTARLMAATAAKGGISGVSSAGAKKQPEPEPEPETEKSGLTITQKG